MAPERRFLITGAQGFIGAWIIKNLVEAGQRPHVFDISTEPKRLEILLGRDGLESVVFLQGDVTRLEDLDRAVRRYRITHLLHLAALQVPHCAANPPLGGLVNVVGTLNVLEVARRHRDRVERVVYASSAAVFGPEAFYGSGTVAEGAPLYPGTHYGVFKQCNEGNARVYFQSHGISSAGLRPWAVYGVGRDQGITSGPTKALKAAVLGRPYTIGFTGGLDLQFVDDTARIFLRCAETPLEGARTYTLRGSVIHIEEFIATLERIFPQAAGLIRAQGPSLPIAYDLDDSLLVKDLGQVPSTPMEEGMMKTIEIFERLQREGRLETEDLEL